jgi:thiol-disulfide isomerase/thioredoxin
MYALFDMKNRFPRKGMLALAVSMVMAGLVSVAGLTSAGGETAAPTAATADALWTASFKDTSGTPKTFEGLKGKIAIVYFWATWCEPCQKEAPQLKALFEKYRDKGVDVLGIAMDNADKVKDFVAKHQLTFPIVYGGREAIQLSKDLGNSLGGIPYLVVIGKDGKIVERITGETKDGRVEGIITPLLGG